MFARQGVPLKRGHDIERACTVQEELEGMANRPHFLMQGLAWVEFQRIALHRQQQELLGTAIENVYEPLTERGDSLLL